MHYTNRRFWECYDALPEDVQRTADQCYELLKSDPSHPSLHFKKVGKYWSYHVRLITLNNNLDPSPYHRVTASFLTMGVSPDMISVRAGKNYRALGVEVKTGILWFWIGTHAEYNKLIQN